MWLVLMQVYRQHCTVSKHGSLGRHRSRDGPTGKSSQSKFWRAASRSTQLAMRSLKREKGVPGMLHIAARQIRVLVVDDSSTFLSTLCSLLQDDPRIELVASARSGLEALTMVEELHPDLVFMDLQLPDLNGLKVTARLHHRFPRLPVVMMTSHDVPGLREVCKRGGVYAFATKGRLLQELSAILAHVTASMNKPRD